MAKKVNLGPEVEKLTVQIGDFMHYWGFKRIHGQIWAHIFLSQDPLDAQSLIDRIGVSKALISISIKDLLEYDVIKEIGKSEKGTYLYEPNPNVVEVILNVLRKRERKMLSDIEMSCKSVRDLSQDDKKKMNLNHKRVRTMGRMIKEAQNTLTGMIALGELSLSSWKDIEDAEL